MDSAASTLSPSSEQALAVTRLEMAAMASGHIDQYFLILADDTMFMPPNTTAKMGAELRKWLKDFLDSFTVEWLKVVEGETVVVGELAYHDYAYKMKSTPKAGGDPVIGTGKGVEVLRRESDGNWKIVRNVWNAAPEPALP